MNIQLKSLLHLLRRYPLPIVGNVAGLAVGIASFLIISMEVNYNRTFDRQITDVDRIFLLTTRDTTKQQYNVAWSRPACEGMPPLSPHIEAMSFRNYYYTHPVGQTLNDVDVKTDLSSVGQDYFGLFGFDWLTCDTTALADPQAVFLPASLAQSIYGTTHLLHQPVNPSSPGQYIGGIYRDFPENSSLHNAVYHYMGDENKGVWTNSNYQCFLKLTDADRREDVEKQLHQAVNNGDDRYSIHLIPYADLHFRPDIETDRTAVTVNPDTQYLFLFIALIIILIACINFTNLYAALCPLRMRSINTRKVLGATRGELVVSLIGEATLVSLAAWLTGLGMVCLAPRMGMDELQHATVSLTAHPALTGASLLLALAMGIGSALYPAFYATSFQPALALKGNFGLSPRGRSLRNLLMGVQFTTAFALLICLLNAWQQNDFMRNSPLGYNQHSLINIPTSELWKAEGGREAFVEGVRQLAVVEDAAVTFNRLSSLETGQMLWSRPIDGDEDNYLTYMCMPVSYNFLHTAGITITEGRDFLPTDVGNVIFNEAARRKAPDLRLGTSIDGCSVVGFCEDFKYGNIHNEVGPMAFMLMNTPERSAWPWDKYLVVRLKDGLPAAQGLEVLQRYAAARLPDNMPEILSQADVMDITYAEDNRQLKSIFVFCLLSIFICLTGVFGLVVFECEYRRKEIGIRKVVGASTADVIGMLCRRYVWILAVSYAVAVLPAWYAVDTWLQNFAYRTEILPRTFIVPLIGLLAVTLLTVCLQSLRTARTNPMDSLRTE